MNTSFGVVVRFEDDLALVALYMGHLFQTDPRVSFEPRLVCYF